SARMRRMRASRAGAARDVALERMDAERRGRA
ncbi:MAG: heme exporter protein CcmD, partial [Methyloversatilis sp. 12-65-5]